MMTVATVEMVEGNDIDVDIDDNDYAYIKQETAGIAARGVDWISLPVHKVPELIAALQQIRVD